MLIDAVEAMIVRPGGVTLTERERADAREIVRKLVEGVELDLRHFMPAQSARTPVAWSIIAERGLPVEGLARHVLARALERGLDRDHENGDAHHRPPGWIADDAELSALWMRYIIADRRRRDGWRAPMIVVAELPVEIQATLTEYVAGAMFAQQRGPETEAESCVEAVARVISLYREETGIDIAAARLVDAALINQPAHDLIDDLIARGAWPAIIALLGRFSGADRNDAAIFLSSATGDEIGAWLSPTGIGEGAIASLCQTIAMREGSRNDERVGGIPPPRSGKPSGRSTAERIASAADYYRSLTR